MLAEIIKQLENAERLLQQATLAAENARGLRSGDRVWTPLVEEVIFQQGAAPSTNVVFNVPADADFWAYRLLLFPHCRVIDPVNGTPDEVTYRPTSFIGEPFSTGAVDPESEYTDFNCAVDGTFALIYQGKELQNIDTPWQAAYCSNMGKWIPSTTQQVAIRAPHYFGGANQTPGGLVFDIPFFIPRGGSLTLRLTPTYLGVRTIEEPIGDDETIVRQHEYKIIAVLEGEKKTNPMR